MSLFKQKYSFEDRKIQSTNIRCKYNNRIPIIVEKMSKKDIDIDKNKYLVPVELTLGEFIYILRKRLNITSDKALFIFINNTMPNSSINIYNIYNKHKEPDGFLYLHYYFQETFG